MQRLSLLKAAALAVGLPPIAAFGEGFGNQDLNSPFPPRNRLEQGPFDIDQDESWFPNIYEWKTANVFLHTAQASPVLRAQLERAHFLPMYNRPGRVPSPNFQPRQIAQPEFLRDRIPMVKVGKISNHGDAEYIEPRYDHPEFQKAFAELNQLLAEQFDGDPLIEWVDAMRQGFRGEGHTSNYRTRSRMMPWHNARLWACEQPLNRRLNRGVIDE